MVFDTRPRSTNCELYITPLHVQTYQIQVKEEEIKHLQLSNIAAYPTDQLCISFLQSTPTCDDSGVYQNNSIGSSQYPNLKINISKQNGDDTSAVQWLGADNKIFLGCLVTYISFDIIGSLTALNNDNDPKLCCSQGVQ